MFSCIRKSRNLDTRYEREERFAKSPDGSSAQILHARQGADLELKKLLATLNDVDTALSRNELPNRTQMKSLRRRTGALGKMAPDSKWNRVNEKLNGELGMKDVSRLVLKMHKLAEADQKRR